MRQLMGQQMSALFTCWIILVLTEDDIIAQGKGAGIDGLCRTCGAIIGMHTYVAKIFSKTRLKKGTFEGRQGLSCTFKVVDIMGDSGGDLWRCAGIAFWLNPFFLFLLTQFIGIPGGDGFQNGC